MGIYMLKTTSIAAAAFGLGIGWLSLADASPEEEIARLDRVRQNLFEELVQTRREVASLRAELEAMTKARDQAEAELARLKQQAASPKPEAQEAGLPASKEEAARQPEAGQADDASPKDVAPRHAAHPAPAAGAPPHRKVRSAVSTRETMRPENTHPVRRASDAPASTLPSVLQLQHP